MITDFQGKKKRMLHKIKASVLRASELDDFLMNKSEIVDLKHNKTETKSQK